MMSLICFILSVFWLVGTFGAPATQTPTPTSTATATETPVPTMTATVTQTLSATMSLTPTEFDAIMSDSVVSINVTAASLNVSLNNTLGISIVVAIPGVSLSNRGYLSFDPNDAIQSPIVLYLKSCDFTILLDNNQYRWDCPNWLLPTVILDGTDYHLSWMSVYIFPDNRLIRIPYYKLPQKSFVVLSSVYTMDTSSSSNITFYDAYTNYWSFLLGGDQASLYFRDSTKAADNTTLGWLTVDNPMKGDPKLSGFTAMCYYNKSLSFVVGAKNYSSGAFGRGFVLAGINNVFTKVADTGSRTLLSVVCKTSSNFLPFIAVGVRNTIILSQDGLTWRNATTINDNISDYQSVGCLSEDVCLVLGKWEDGLNWRTVVLKTEDGGDTWNVIYTLTKERAMAMSCVLGTQTCYFSTEIYTGSMIHKTEDGGKTWQAMTRWDVLSNVRLHCYWADQCIAGAGTWLGRWYFPAEIKMTYDGGYTWQSIFTGQVGDFVGDCKCGGLNNDLCLCTVNNKLMAYTVSLGTWSNITFPQTLGPMADFQSYFAADILREFYVQTQGVNWLRNDNWLGGNPCTYNWYGVLCDGVDGAASDVIEIKLPRNGLNGSLPATMGLLVRLKNLELEVNQLNGPIPSSFGRMTGLERLSLFNNYLSGTITRQLGSCTNLKMLALFNNEFTGTIADVFGQLTNLRWMFLYNNKLSGQIPASFGNLKSLHWLNLRSNQLTGTFPPELGQLTDLRALDLGKNFISGTIPSTWNQFIRLTYCDVGDADPTCSFVTTPLTVVPRAERRNFEALSEPRRRADEL